MTDQAQSGLKKCANYAGGIKNPGNIFLDFAF